MKRIAVFGLGKVGALVALLLHEGGFEVIGYDLVAPRGRRRSGSPRPTRRTLPRSPVRSPASMPWSPAYRIIST